MKAICYTLELQQPVLVTDVQSEPNGAVSMPYVTGSLMRGALAARYLKRAGTKTFDALTDTEARALFLSTTTRYLNAYPCNHDGERALPVPRAWYYDKNDGYSEKDAWRRIYNLSQATPLHFQEQGIGTAFVWLHGSTASLYTPPRQVNVHTQRDAQKGRATELAGAVYRYDALASGLRLKGVILTADEHANTISNLLDNATLWLGRARRAGYGQAVVTEVDTHDHWHELRDEQDDELMVDNELQITFTSNALLRDDNGQATLDPLAALAAKLGVAQASLVPQVQRCFAAATVVGGFNRKWGLPLPQTTAIEAGSVFTYQIEAPIPFADLEALEQDGIGERRAEGFGRAVVNGFMQPRYESKRVELSDTPQAPDGLSSIEKSLAETIADRLLRNALDIELRRKINSIKLEKPPTKNQLARLRVVLRDLQTGLRPSESIDRDRWEQYLASLEERRSTSEQFKRARVDENEAKYELLTWLKEQVEQAQQKWPCEPVCLGSDDVSVQAEVDTALAEEYALRLLDGVLSAAYRSRSDG